MFSRLKAALPDLRKLLEDCSSMLAYEDGLYRFYHRSFKVYGLQGWTKQIVATLQALAPGRPLHPFFADMVKQGTGIEFEPGHNSRWAETTRPVVEAFLHAKYFLEMTVKFGDQLESPPTSLPSGWASVLYLFGMR